MHDPPPPDLHEAVRSSAEAIWEMLCDDAGCSVTVTDEHGRIAWANDRAIIDYEWHLATRFPDGSGDQLDPIGKTFLEIFGPPGSAAEDSRRSSAHQGVALARERLQLIRDVVTSGRPVVYESVLRGVRQRIALRPLPARPGLTAAPGSGASTPRWACFIARRMRASERIEDLVPEGVRLVRLTTHDRGPLEPLTDREIEILTLVGEGLSSAEIAHRLGRSVRTIEGHRTAIGAKLGLSKGADLVRVAIRAGLCELPDGPDQWHARGAEVGQRDTHAPSVESDNERQKK